MFRKMRGNWLAAAAVLVLVLPALAAAGPFDNLPFDNLPYDKLPLDRIPMDHVPFAYSDYTELYVLGNSLSDVGNVFIASDGAIPVEPYWEGRFTNGPNYTDYVAETYGLLNDPYLDGGTNFAWGGATTSDENPYLVSGVEQLAQYQAFAAVYPPDADALFVVFLGGNNLRDIITDAGEAVLNQQNPAPIIEAGVAQAMGDMVYILGILIGFGAANFVVPNLPNMGLVPDVTLQFNGALVPLATSVSLAYNDALEELLTYFDSQANIMRVDVYGFFEEVVAHPASFGLSNATDPCFYVKDGVLLSWCSNPDEYLFWDTIHPTTVGHMLLADAVFDAVRQDNLPAAVSKNNFR